MNYPGIINKDDIAKLEGYARLIYDSNQLFNLTGLKTINDIRNILICASLIPFSAINVPRGTFIADMGSGAGIPGIPLCVKFPESKITMFDATLKKIEFINSAINNLQLNNAWAVNGRLEEVGHDGAFRECFDWVITRAMADLYAAAELGSPLLKKGGYMYLYVNEKSDALTEKTMRHIAELGMILIDKDERWRFMHVECEGILLKKTENIKAKYPRRINAIRRAGR